jgi:hypothetical protein
MLNTMNTQEQELVTELFGLINRLVDLIIEEKIKPLQDELKLVKSRVSEWVDTKEAARISGITDDTLRAERKRPGTLIRVKFEGSKPYYLRDSLVAYSEARIHIYRHGAGRNLAV